MLVAIENKERHSWVLNLKHEIADIRKCVTEQQAVSLCSPKVHAVPDVFNPKKVRVISVFDFRDRVILSLASQYLSSLVDPFLQESSIAFRQARQRNARSALRELQELNLSRGSAPLHVGECDIRSFFDVLSHGIIEDSLRLIAERMAAAGIGIDPRVLDLVRAYLASYSFPKSVLPVLPLAKEKWPLEALQEFYMSPLDEPLGIPQGGALSNILINIVMDRADRAVESYRQECGRPIYYRRYCDDSLIIALESETCAKAFEVYLEVLCSLRLPIHAPVTPPPYLDKGKKQFWDAKSRAPYVWGANAFPWVGFLGFQFRYDGLARLRPGTVKKMHMKMSKMARQLQSLAGKRKPNTTPTTIKQPSAKRIRRFLLNKTMASAFGRNWQDRTRSSKRSIFAWISMLKWWRHDRSFLGGLDRHLGRLATVVLRASSAEQDGQPKKNLKRWSFSLNYARRMPTTRKMPPRGNS